MLPRDPARARAAAKALAACLACAILATPDAVFAAARTPGGLAGLKLAPTTPGAVRFTVRVPAPRLVATPADAGMSRLELEGFEAAGLPGEPAIPARTVLVAVPPVGEVRLTAVASEVAVSEDVTLSPNRGLDEAGQPAVLRRDPAAYGRSGASTPAAARILAVTWLRNQRVAQVVIEPVAYEPALRRLHVAARVDVELAVSAPGTFGPPAEPDDPFDAIYRESLVNYEQGRGWRRPRTADLTRAVRRPGASATEIAALTVPPDTSVFVGRTWIKIAIQKTGFYAVNFSRLRGLALFDPTSPARIDSLRLFTWPGRTVLPEDSYCDTCDYREVAIGIVRDASDDTLFSSNDDAFYFFAQGPDGWASDYGPATDTTFINHPYEKFNYYYLTVATTDRPVTTDRYPIAALRIGDSPISTRDVTPSGTYTDQTTVAGRLHVEQDLEFWPDATAIKSTYNWEKWFWRSIVPGQSFPFTFSLPDADTTQPARFRLRQWGLTRNSLLPNCAFPGFDHKLDVSFNSVTFPQRMWQGFTARGGVQTYDTTGLFLNRVANNMTVSVPFYTVPGCPSFTDRSGLAFFEIYYERRLLPVGDAIDFRTHPVTGRFRYDIGPFLETPPSYVFDVTEPLRPVLLTGALTIPTVGDTTFALAIVDTQSVAHRYVVVPDAIIEQNTSLLPVTALSDASAGTPESPGSLTNLRSVTQGADYLVIYFDGFATAAESLRVWRSSHLPLLAGPHVARKVPITAIFDQFSGGRVDPGAIRNFLRAASDWSLRPLYVTFLGDASFDYKDITGRAVPGQPSCLLPTFENNFDDYAIIFRQYATDDWLVNVNDPITVLPDYLAGRIPAGDAASALDVVVNKILAYERRAPFGEYRNVVMLMADDNAQGPECNANSCNDCDPIGWGHVLQTDALNVGHTPPETDREYVYLHTYTTGPGGTRPGARTALFQDLNRGASILNYVGHGSPFKMTDEAVFLDSDAGTLTNGLKLPVLVAASCDVGKFNDPTVQSLGERLFMSTNGGSIAVISATEQALSGLNSFLNTLIYDALFTRDTITVADVHLPATGQYHLPLSAALLAAKSVPSAQGTNSEKYQVMGDAATLLNLPRLWSEIELTDEQGAAITQLASGQHVLFNGRVLDQPGGTLVAMDGVASVLMEDSAPTNLTPNECNPSVPYRFNAGPMYHGDVTLKGGTFHGSFVVPLDASTGSEGRARAYVSGQVLAGGQADGVGSVRTDLVPGQPPAGDGDGPRITLSFVGGSTNVRPDATLQISLFDQSGIMTTGHAPQNSIVVTLDGNTTSRVDVTSSFRYAADSYQSGTASFQLPNLPRGAHTVQVTAADNLATGIDAGLHRSRATLEFEVVDTPPLRVARTFLFPNPVASGGPRGGGVFVVDAPGDSINTQIRVYTVAGKLVRVLRQFGGIGQIQVTWDGRDDQGEALAQGTYLYKVYVSAREADGKSSPRQNATAEGRFVVLSP